jgi:glycolate oxidase FAD binding subunit
MNTILEACDDVRRGGPDDAVAGVMPSYVAYPASVDEAAAVMRAAAAHNLAVVPRGTGTKLAWGVPPDRCDLVVDTTRLDRIIEHAAGDMMVRVQAGVPMERLAGVLREAWQQLALDPPSGLDRYGPDGSDLPGQAGPGPRGAGTIGGVLATGVAGPRRLRYGTPRDLVIGITVIRADGTVARSGGKVAKNVAGYDLGKLFAGSYGTLGLIAEATFRLHPQPVASAHVTMETDDAGAVAAVAAALESPLLPSAVEIDRPRPGGPVQVSVLLEGGDPPSAVAERASRLRDTLGQDAWSDGFAPQWWYRSGVAPADGTLIRIAFWAGTLPAVLNAIDAAASSAGLDPAVGGSAGAGVLYVTVDGGAEPDAIAAFAAALRPRPPAVPAWGGTVPSGESPGPHGPRPPAALAWGDDPPRPPASRGSVVVVSAPPRIRSAVDLWGPVPGIALMRAVKDQFDPEHRMAPGRFAGGI